MSCYNKDNTIFQHLKYRPLIPPEAPYSSSSALAAAATDATDAADAPGIEPVYVTWKLVTATLEKKLEEGERETAGNDWQARTQEV